MALHTLCMLRPLRMLHRTKHVRLVLGLGLGHLGFVNNDGPHLRHLAFLAMVRPHVATHSAGKWPGWAARAVTAVNKLGVPGPLATPAYSQRACWRAMIAPCALQC